MIVFFIDSSAINLLWIIGQFFSLKHQKMISDTENRQILFRKLEAQNVELFFLATEWNN